MSRFTQAVFAASVGLSACILAPFTASAQLPEEARKVLSYYVGTWQHEWEVEGKKYSGTWSAKWSPNESCLISHWSSNGPDGPAKGTKITGWDIARGQSVDLEFAANGEHVLARYKIVSGKVESGESIGATLEGKTTRSKLRVDKEPDKFKWTVSDRVEGDKKLPDLVFVFRRVKKEN